MLGNPRRAIGILVLTLLLLPVDEVAAGALERAMLGKSAIVDLTQVQREAPGTGGQDPRHDSVVPGKDAGPATRPIPRGEFATQLDLATAPSRGPGSVARIPPRNLLGLAVVVDVATRVAETADYRASVADLRAWERKNGRIPRRAVVLLHTGWSGRWADPARYMNLDAQGVPHVPGFSPDAVAFLGTDREVLGVGLDAWAPESVLSEAVLAKLRPGAWQLLNLTNLDRLPAKGAKLMIAPIRVEAGSAPARVVAILP